MPKKIPLIEMRNWLRQYEQGKSVAAIARHVRHDVRTVTHGIEQARHESEARAARSEMLKDALQKHQDDLAEVIESLQSAVVVPPLNIVLPVEGTAPRRITLPQASAKRESKNEWTITLGIESSTKWELFQEHMRRDSIWKVISQWKNAVAAHLEARLVLSEKVISLLREKSGLDVMESVEKAGNNYLYPAGIQAIYAHTLNWALGISSKVSLERELRASDPRLYYGQERIPILDAPGSVDEYKVKVLSVFNELQKPAVINQIITSYQAVEEITHKASKAIEELSLLRLVPGQCRVCRRLGL